LVEVVHPDETRIGHEYSCCAGTRTVDEDGRVRTAQRDPLLRVVGVADGQGHTATTTWDAAGRRTSWSDRSGRVWHCTHDEDGRPHTVTDPLGHELRFEHDASGRLVGVVDRRGNRTTFVHDAAGRLVHTVRPSGLADTVEYTDHHRIRRVANRRGQVTELEHDADGAIAAISGTDRAPVRFGHDAAGRLVTMTDDRGRTVWERDAAGRVTAETGPDGRTVRFAYTATGALASIMLPDGAAIASTYDQRGRVVAAAWPGGGIRFGYDPVGRLTAEHRSNGVDSTYDYDAVGALARIRHAGAEVLADLSYRRDPAGRVVEAWGIEPLAPSPTPGDVAAEFGPSDEVLTADGRRWEHDEDGNVVRIGDELALAYDPDGRIRRIDAAAGRHEFVHDGLGRCVERRGPDGTVRFLHDPFGRVIAEVDPNGTVLRAVVHRGEMVAAWFGPGGSRFPLGDQAGNVIAVTDDHEAAVAVLAYTPAGEVVGADGPEADASPFRFAGLYGVRAVGDLAITTRRCYHPASGRFLQPDPLGLLGGPNLYVYAANDPVDLVDPHGTAGQPHVSMSTRGWNPFNWLIDHMRSTPSGPYRPVETPQWERNLWDSLRELDTGVRNVPAWVQRQLPRFDVVRVPGISQLTDMLEDVGAYATTTVEQIQATTVRETEEFLEWLARTGSHLVWGGSQLVSGMDVLMRSADELRDGVVMPTIVRISDLLRTPLAGLFPAHGVVPTADGITDRLQAGSDTLSTPPRRGGCPPP
jgi:RHS repeat-associated protein